MTASLTEALRNCMSGYDRRATTLLGEAESAFASQANYLMGCLRSHLRLLATEHFCAQASAGNTG